MKLRNKKTGEIWDTPKMRHPTVQEDDISFFAMLGTNGELFSYHSLAELNAEWEDYKPAEPRIEDKRVRKIIRAWAEMCGVTTVEFFKYGDEEEFTARKNDWSVSISFNFPLKLEESRTYTIPELCGEEE